MSQSAEQFSTVKVEIVGDRYFIVAGNRRWGAVDAGCKPVNCAVVDGGIREVYWLRTSGKESKE